MDIKILEHLLQVTIERGNLWKRQDQILYKRIMVDLGLLKSARYGELIHERTWKPVSVHYQEQAYSENFVMGSDAAEFVNKVRDQVRIRQKRISSIADNCAEHSIIWGMFMATTLNAATFMGKNFSIILSFVKNFEDLTLKQMFDVTAQLVG